MILMILFGFFCVLAVSWVLKLRLHDSNEPPLLSGWLPILGHAHRIMGNNIQMLKSVVDITKECEEKGGITTIYLGFYKVYGIMDPEDSLTLMNTCLQKHMFYDFLKPMFGNGIFVSDVPTWKRNRKLLNPAFGHTVLNGYIDIFNAQAERLVEQFSTEVGKSFNHLELLKVNGLETVCATSLGLYGSETKYASLIKLYVERLSNALNLFNGRMQKFWLYSDFIYNLTAQKRQQDIEVKELSALSKLILEKKKADRKRFGSDHETNRVRPFIDLILDLAEEEGVFTDEQLKSEVDNILIGGHDTGATILTYAIAELGSNPLMQKKAIDEIHSVLGNSGGRIDKEAVSKLEYIEAIIKETLRLHVVVPVLARHVDKDVQLKKYKIKANSDCFILIHGINRHKGLWGADADQFRPERWLEKDSLPDAKYFAPLGLGKRACIGKAYAILSMKITLTHILRAYHVTSDFKNIVQKMYIIVKPVSGHHVTFTKRN